MDAEIGIAIEQRDVWCVWTKHGRRPTYWHADRASAETEATRLARKHPKLKFNVLHLVAKIGAEA